MAILSYTVSVTDVPTLLVNAPADGDGTMVYLTNNSQVEHVFIGGPNIAANSGYEVINQTGGGIGNRAEFKLFGGEKLYVVCAATKTASIGVIVSGG